MLNRQCKQAIIDLFWDLTLFANHRNRKGVEIARQIAFAKYAHTDESAWEYIDRVADWFDILVEQKDYEEYRHIRAGAGYSIQYIHDDALIVTTV